MAKEEAGREPPAEPKGLLDRMIGDLKQGWEDLRIGDGHAAAMGRLGLAELRNAMNPSKDSVADRDFGLYGSATQGEIADAREGDKSMTMKDLREQARERSKEAEKGMEGQERDRGMGV